MHPHGNTTATTHSMPATTSTANKRPKLRFNTYGFNVGGQVPFAKSHPTFFFYNMEWRKLRQGGNYNQTVPLPSTYGGNFGGTAINVPTSRRRFTPSILFKNCPAVSLRRELCQGAAFPNNTIPSCMLDPNAQLMLKAGIFPAPTNGTQFQGSPARRPMSAKRSSASITSSPTSSPSSGTGSRADSPGIRHHDVER